MASGPVNGPLTVAGTKIVDATGQPVALRGVNSTWLVDHAKGLSDGSPLSDRSVATMRGWGMNVVRIMLAEQLWNRSECDYSPAYATTVDRVVRSVTSRGMIAMLDLHTATGTRCSKPRMLPMADEGSLTMWGQLADRYKSNPLVAFDVFNEPHGISDEIWLHGTAGSSPLGYRVVGMQRLVDTIRSTGAKNLVFVSGNSWGATPPRALLAGSNVVYATHSYTCPTQAPPKCSAPDPFDAAPSNGARLSAWDALASKAPVVVTEFGWPGFEATGAFIRNVITWSEQHAQGWLGFEWAGAPETASTFALLNDTRSLTPNTAGRILRGAIQTYGRETPPAKPSAVRSKAEAGRANGVPGAS